MLGVKRQEMGAKLKIISTDFDGTFHAEHEDPSVPSSLQRIIKELQAEGVVWVINTGRDLASLSSTLNQSQLSVCPDYVVTVEREIYALENSQYTPLEDWNRRCQSTHEGIFREIRSDVPDLAGWIRSRFAAKVYEDPYSPLCLIADSVADADRIQDYLDDYSRRFPNLTVVRNGIYARFSHADYNKGSALGEISRRLDSHPRNIVAAGDHLNDLPMLSARYARWLIAPSNAIEEVKDTVRQQNGFISDEPFGFGVFRGLEWALASSTGD